MLGIRQEEYGEYEGFYRICFHCGKFGHRTEGCPILAGPPVETRDMVEASRGTVHNEPEHLRPPYGPWMLPAHVQRRQQLAEQWMSRQAMPSEANRHCNAQVEKELQSCRDQQTREMDESKNYRWVDGSNNRGKLLLLATQADTR